MVLIQLLLPTSGAARAWSSLPRPGRSWRIDSTASRRSRDHPRRDGGPHLMAIRNRDDVVMVEVVTHTFDRAWWRT